MQLRGYQTEGLSTIPEDGRGIIVWPTGAGKGVAIAELARRRGGRTLVLAHRDELINQACDKLKIVWANADVGVVKAERNEADKQVVVASIQTVSRNGRLSQLGQAWRTCIVDEVHHATEPSYRRVLDFIDAPLTVGFTATPFRADGKDLREVFPLGVLHQKSLLWMIREGYLCNLRAKRIELNVDLSGVRVAGGDYAEEALGKALRAEGASEEIARAYVDHASPRKALCFTASVAQAHEIAEKLVNMGVAAAAVWGDQDLEERRKTLRRFSEGGLRVVVNHSVLLEGYDEPSIECVMIARPTLSKLLYTQEVGRGTRLYPGKSDCLILDFVAASARHSLESLASMFGITEKSAEAGIEALLAAAGEAEAGGAVVGSSSEDVSLWAAPVGRLHWVPDGRRFLLSAGDATLALVPAGLSWEIKEFPRGKDSPTVKLFAGLTLDYAQGVAEDLVRARGAWALAAEGAGWRLGPASDAQRKIFLEKGWGEPASKGAASDRMTIEFNRRRG